MSRLAIVVLAIAGCGHAHHHDAPAEPAAVSFTAWTAQHEFFVEHPPFVAGQSAALAAHVTKLDGHAAVSAGPLTAVLKQGATVTEAIAREPSRPGIFRPALVPATAGPCTLSLRIANDEVSVPCVVHAAGAKLPAEEAEAPGRITYTKEMAWSTQFEVMVAGERELVPTLRTTGEIRATAGREARLTATAHGRVLIDEPMPVLGTRVKAGQVLARIVPQIDNAGDRVTLAAELRQARAELAAAEAELARSQRLWDARTIPEKQLESARTRAEVARARVDAAGGKLRQFDVGTSGRGTGATTYQIRSPIAGTLVAIHVSPGQSVEDGERLFTVVDLDRVWLHADIFEPDIAAVEDATRATFRVDGYDRTFPIAPPDGRVVTIGKLVDDKTRTVPMIFELANPDQQLRIGSFATVWIETGAPLRALALPESAIVDDAGRKVVYVQVEGEAFERRLVTTGLRSGGWVAIASGITAGERVVTHGAYEIKLAAAGGAVPGHGHAH
jgi:RND family efflux transporter MFP subunit